MHGFGLPTSPEVLGGSNFHGVKGQEPPGRLKAGGEVKEFHPNTLLYSAPHPSSHTLALLCGCHFHDQHSCSCAMFPPWGISHGLNLLQMGGHLDGSDFS